MLDSTLFSRHLEEDEIVTKIVHKHWLLGLRALAAPSVALLLGLIVMASARIPLVFQFAAVFCIASIMWWLRNFFDYYMDAWIITNQGIIDLEWFGLFHRQSSRILYSDVQGVSYEVKGFWGTVLRYGTVSVEKISTGSAVSLSHVHQPKSVESQILKNMETYLHTKNMKDSKHVQEILAGIVAEQVQLKELAPATAKPAPKPVPVAKQPASSRKAGGFTSKSIRSR